MKITVEFDFDRYFDDMELMPGKLSMLKLGWEADTKRLTLESDPQVLAERVAKFAIAMQHPEPWVVDCYRGYLLSETFTAMTGLLNDLGQQAAKNYAGKATRNEDPMMVAKTLIRMMEIANDHA